MQITNLTVRNFRNYAQDSAEFVAGLNVIMGENAAGKTNLLEAVYLAGVGRSPRTKNEKELIKNGEDKAYISLSVQKKFRKHKIEIQLSCDGAKKIFLDGLPVLRSGELLGVLNVVYFSPDEMKLVKESPEYRRRFLDISLSQQGRVYFSALSRYNKILKQRNNLLKNSAGKSGLSDMLDIWDAQLSEYGAQIVQKRVEFLKKLQISAKKIHFDMSGGKEDLELYYECDKALEEYFKDLESGGDAQKTHKNANPGGNLNEISQILLKNLKNSRDKDVKLQFTTNGAHRDDIKIAINGADVRKYASQGQQRTTALALKLGETELFLEQTGELPVLLLDDVLSELDESRQKLLLSSTAGAQTLLTCTEFELPVPANLLRIRSGKILK